jgi:hypothetical protein
MTRIDGWEARLAEEIEAARGKPFVWGHHDCATWAFDVRRALTRQDAAAAWRGRYSSARGAVRTLRLVLGAATHADAATAILGPPLDRVLTVQRGDIVLAGDVFGVCAGAVCAFLAPDGLTFRPVTEIDMAWRV